MTINAEVVSVGTTATALNVAEVGASDRVSVLVAVPTSATKTVYLGGAGVDTTDGYPLTAGQQLSLNALANGEVWYAVVATGTQDVNVMRQGVG